MPEPIADRVHRRPCRVDQIAVAWRTRPLGRARQTWREAMLALLRRSHNRMDLRCHGLAMGSRRMLDERTHAVSDWSRPLTAVTCGTARIMSSPRSPYVNRLPRTNELGIADAIAA